MPWTHFDFILQKIKIHFIYYRRQQHKFEILLQLPTCRCSSNNYKEIIVPMFYFKEAAKNSKANCMFFKRLIQTMFFCFPKYPSSSSHCSSTIFYLFIYYCNTILNNIFMNNNFFFLQ